MVHGVPAGVTGRQHTAGACLCADTPDAIGGTAFPCKERARSDYYSQVDVAPLYSLPNGYALVSVVRLFRALEPRWPLSRTKVMTLLTDTDHG